jgi:imidazolonepropionase-like amidohydrolase
MDRRHQYAWLCLSVFLCSSAASAYAAEPPPVVIRNTSLFEPVAQKMLPDRTIFLEGGKIKTILGPGQEVVLPPGARVIDGRGKFVLPGLIDAHVHLVHRLNFAHVTGDEVLPLFLAAGVTSVRDTGDEIVAQTLVARFAEAHPEISPRVFTCSGLIDANPPIHRDIGLPVTDPEKVPALVDDMKAWKVTTLKIYAGSGRPVGRRVIEEGHRHGLVVTGHLSAYPAPEAVGDGIDCLEHITSVFDFIIPAEARKQPDHRAKLELPNDLTRAFLPMLARKKVFVDPTLTVFRNMLLLSDVEEIHNHADVARVPARLRDYWHQYRKTQGFPLATREARRQVFVKYQELTGLLYKAGVPLLAGTDTPEPFCPPGFSLHQELERMVESGVPPAATLQAATIHNARALRQDERLGSIEVGKLADMVILSADPLADIRNTRKIDWVIRGGVIVEPAKVLAAVPMR